MFSQSQIYESAVQAVLTQAPNITQEKSLAQLALNMIYDDIQAENALRDKGQKLTYPKDLPPVCIAQLIANRTDVALISSGNKSGSKNTKLTAEQKQKLPIGIYQQTGDNIGVWEIANDPCGTFGELVERYKSDATKNEKNEISILLKNRLRVIEKCVDPHYVCCNNGIWDFYNMTLLQHTPDLVFTSKIHTNLDVNAVNPVINIQEDGTTWDVDNWLASLGSPTFVSSIKEVIQAGCLPLAPRNQMCLFYSKSGNNGKGTICQIIRNLLGTDVVKSIPLNEFAVKFALADLPNSIAIITDENSVNNFGKGMGILKSVITGDVVTIEQKYQPSYDYAFRGLVLQCINDFPKVDDKTGSFKRRLHIIPFENCFTGNEKKYIKDRLIHRDDVLEYILKLVLVDMPYRDSFSETPETKKALDLYIAMTNSVVSFLQEILPECQWDLLPATDFLYESYKAWYRQVSPSGKVIGRNDFIDSVKEFIATDPQFNTEWEWTDSTRSQGYIDKNIQEPLLDKYNLVSFMRDRECTSGVNRYFAWNLKSKYSGLKRKSAKANTQATNNNNNDDNDN